VYLFELGTFRIFIITVIKFFGSEMASAPLFLRIPIVFEKQVGNAWLSKNYDEIFRVFNKYMDRKKYKYGYKTYIIYAIFEISVVSEKYKTIRESLHGFGREFIISKEVNGVSKLRRLFLNMISYVERKFLKKYGIDEKWISNKILTRRPIIKINNYYFKVYLEDLEHGLKDGLANRDLEKMRLYIRKSILFGVEVFLLLHWYITIYSYIIAMLRKIIDEDRLMDVLYENHYLDKVIYILDEVVKLFGVDLAAFLTKYPTKNYIRSLDFTEKITKRDSGVVWVGMFTLCWNRYVHAYMSKYGLVDEHYPNVLCKLCLLDYESIYSNFDSNFESVNIDFELPNAHVCVVSIKAVYKESYSEANMDNN